MRVTVKLFARFREAVGSSSLERELAEGNSVADLLAGLAGDFPKFPAESQRVIVAVNREFASRDTVLQPGDEVALFPPVSGGAGMFKIAAAPIALEEVTKAVVRPHCGAVVTFVGVVRNESQGKQVSHLEYEAYPPMAEKQMQQIAQEITERWPAVVDVAMVQRVGRLQVGDVAAVIAVSTAHRDEGCFEACRYAIDRLKEIVPVWKKEVGPDGTEWVEGDYLPAAGGPD
jgi:molybdopterin converting factor subunit 1